MATEAKKCYICHKPIRGKARRNASGMYYHKVCSDKADRKLHRAIYGKRRTKSK